MKEHFEKAMKFILKWEGGYVNDPADPGGETRYGISKNAHPDVDIRNLTEEGAKEIYLRDYWKPADCPSMKWPLCLVVFDTAVNMGVGRAKRLLEKAEGDWMLYLLERSKRYGSIIKNRPTSIKYINGWMNRVIDLYKTARSC